MAFIQRWRYICLAAMISLMLATAVGAAKPIGVVDNKLVSMDFWVKPWAPDWDSARIVELFKTHGIDAQVIGADVLKSEGKILSRQAYWLRVLKSLTDPAERKKREIDPIAEPQNQKGPWLKPQLESLPTSLKAALLSVETTGAEAEIHISIKNSGSLPAYPVRLTVAPDLYPVLWSDNYFMLAPGESRQISGTVRLDLKGIDPIKNPPVAEAENLTVEVSAWNAKAIKVMQAK